MQNNRKVFVLFLCFLMCYSHIVICKRLQLNVTSIQAFPVNVNFTLATKDQCYRLAEKYYYSNDWRNFKKITDVIYKNRKELNLRETARMYRFYGLYYEFNSMNDSAYHYYLKSEKIFKRIKDIKYICLTHQNKAAIQYYVNDYLGSEASLIEGLKLAKKNFFKEEEISIYNVLGNISTELKDYNKAILYHEKAFKIAQSLKFTKDNENAICLNHIGFNYFSKGNIKESVKFYRMGLSMITEKKSFIYSKLIDNLARAELENNEFLSLPSLFFESFKIRSDLHIDQGQNFNRLYLSQYYTKIKDTLNAKKYALEAYSLSRNYKAPNDMLLCLKHLSKIDPRNALKYSTDYIAISDSVHQQEREARNKFAKIAYETEEITQEKDRAEKQKSIFLGLTIAVATFGFLVFLVIAQRIRQKEMVYTQNQQKAKEEIFKLMQTQQSKIDEGRQIEKKRIARDLHDGIMNKLASTRFNLHILNNKKDVETVEKCIPYIDGLQAIEKEIRDIAHNLNAEVFSEKDSFKRILTTFFEDHKNILQATLHTEIDKSIKWNLLESTVKINIYRILQEALQNIAKHANAENIFVNITRQPPGYLILEVHDDGIGFSKDKVQKGIGLKNIETRAKECDAVFHVNSNVNGTTIVISIPLNQKNNL